MTQKAICQKGNNIGEIRLSFRGTHHCQLSDLGESERNLCDGQLRWPYLAA